MGLVKKKKKKNYLQGCVEVTKFKSQKKLMLFLFQGGVILVSHDERLLKMVCQELWVCSKGRVYSMEGGLDQYRKNSLDLQTLK